MQTKITLLVMLFIYCITPSSFAQESEENIQRYLAENRLKLNLTDADVHDWIISDGHYSKQRNMTYTYINQRHAGIKVYNSFMNFVTNDKALIMSGNTFQGNVAGRVNAVLPTINQEDAIIAAARQLELSFESELQTVDGESHEKAVYKATDLSLENIPVELKYLPINDQEIKLVWDLSIYELSKDHWWSVRVDALTGELLDKVDWVVSCSFESCTNTSHAKGTKHSSESPIVHENVWKSNAHESLLMMPPPPSTDQYNVFAIPVESPNHGSRSLVVGPYDATASPYGWHDDNGSAGAEYTITRGNNVRATEDANGNNGVGYMPSGGASLDFDFPLNLNQDPSNYQDVAITNLFYMNNIMHDIWYHYGFDEAAGNFQQNNYGNGGAGSDYVMAEAQDGSGTNNANFATPADGSRPRMQMYLWDPGIQNPLTVNTPAGIAGSYPATEAGFGGALPATPITSNLVLFDDNAGVDPNDACEPAVNAAAMNGNIVVIMRGDCEFGFKVLAAENAGATAVIMINNVPGAPLVMGAGAVGGSVTIPSVMINDVDGAAILAEMASGTVNASLVDPGPAYDLDGDFDNGVIAHEYGHGISNRLTNGPSSVNCLSNDEQMGEGWSDWFGLMLTIEPGDLETDIRGIGTYASGEGPTGYGIRPAPYTTDWNINGYTYDASNNTATISQPHGVGFVWCTMLWDMTWALINEYGFDADLYAGTGGNNIAMDLVMEGMKLQPCSPGFVDGRDAILLADQNLYGGANQCLIWNAFAARGLGYSASQGSSNSRTDQTEAFDLPPGMVNSTGSESVTACTNYTWPTDGQTYTSTGAYVAVIPNAVGCDSTVTLNLTIASPSSASESASACSSYTWPTTGATYTSTGNYSTTLTNAAGCDSVVTLNLTINPTYAITESVTACTAYTWPANGNTYSSTGMYTTTLTSSTGCDSVVTLDLTMSTFAATTETVNSCISYTWAADGNTYSTTGMYNTTLMSSTGCDSIVTLDLTINTPTSGSESVTSCDTYTWAGNGQTYTSTGSYSATLTNMNGCDSTATLNLTITNSSTNTPETVTTCGSYTWAADGNTYASSGTYYATLTNVAGCDSVLQLDLTISTGSTSGSEDVDACDSYTWSANGTTYSTSGQYQATLQNSEGCDSVATLNLTINTMSTSINYDDVVTLSVAQSGTYQWLDCNNGMAPVAGATNQSFAPGVNGSYACEITSNGCVDTTACRNITSVGLAENDFANSLHIYPNPTFGQLIVEMGEKQEIIHVRLTDVAGRVVMANEYMNAQKLELNIDGAAGYYLLELTTGDEHKATIRVLKE